MHEDVIDESTFKALLVDFGAPIDLNRDLEACKHDVIQWIDDNPTMYTPIRNAFNALEDGDSSLETSVISFIKDVIAVRGGARA